MDQLSTFKDRFKHMMTTEPLINCLQELVKKLNNRDEAFILISEHNEIQQSYRIGQIELKERNQILNQLRSRYMDLVNTLTESDISQLGKILDEIHDNILVVCPPARKEYMQQFFSSYYFKNISYHTDPHSRPLGIDEFQLVVFDPSFEEKVVGTQLLDYFLEETQVYIIYFLKFLDRDKQQRYADRIYFANSIFSLYARIKEMLDFLKYFQG